MLHEDHPLSRRRFLTRSSAAVAGTALAGSLLTRPLPASASCAQVVVSTWGGDYERLLKEFTDPFLKAKSVSVVYDVTRPPQRMTKLIAEKNLKQGSLDVVHFNDSDMYKMYHEGTLAEVDYAKVPSSRYVIKQFSDGYSIPHIYSAAVILYSPQNVKTAPNSFEVFWDPKYKGRVGIVSGLWVTYLQMATMLAGGSSTNYEPGKKMLLDLKKLNPRIYPSQEELAVAIKGGEVWLSLDWRARAYFWKTRGVQVENVVPKEGAIPVLYRAGYAKNAADADCSLAYLDAMLQPQSQVSFAKVMGYVPTVTNAKLPASLEQQIGFSEAERARFFKQEYGYIAQNHNAWLDWWNQEFVG
ncbi:MAG: extracellular solute-binding protein [bacterium]|nr:extracellular solute-binding protein [bacterium]